MRSLLGLLSGLLAASILAVGVNSCAHADIVTEFGFGYKLEGTTSVVLQEQCHTVEHVRTEEGVDIRGISIASCGGDNPAFIGWPIAWEKELDGPWTVRAGWFHLSHWFDGGSDRETHLDAAVVSFKYTWTKGE